MKTQQQLPPEYYRPMSAQFRLQIHSIRAHCLLHSQIVSGKVADLCPIIFTEQLAVELKKHHAEALVQTVIGATVVYFPPSTTLPGAKDGWLTLSALQFRGHGLYSDVEVPWDVEIVEYAWLMEILLGNLRAKIHPGHVST